jgi:LEA14-like dessication related protein
MEIVKLRVLAVAIACLTLCAACGPHKVKGEAPFVSISSMTVRQDSLSARFDIRNINDVNMTVDAIDITIRVRDSELTRHNGSLKLTLDPNTTEEVEVADLPDELARPLLADLENGKVASLPFSLEGNVHTLEDGYLSFKHEGYLYPVPGKPGEFRSATSRTRERR